MNSLSPMRGVDVANLLNSGAISVAPTKELEKVRLEISNALEELLDVGARIRPLHYGNETIGWVRGVYHSEKKILKRWLSNDDDLLIEILNLATSLSKNDIENLTSHEIRSLVRLVTEMVASDFSLYPFLGAYSSTSSSENLWFSKGTVLTNFENKEVTLPDGKKIRILIPSDHAKLWASVCNYREQNKTHLENSLNAATIIRPWVGKGADSFSNDIIKKLSSLRADSIEGWRLVVKPTDKKFDDGWGHSAEDASYEGLKREMEGILANDKHERFMTYFEKQQKEKLELENKVVEQPGKEDKEGLRILSDEELRDLRLKISKNKPRSDFNENKNNLDRYFSKGSK